MKDSLGLCNSLLDLATMLDEDLSYDPESSALVREAAAHIADVAFSAHQSECSACATADGPTGFCDLGAELVEIADTDAVEG